MKDTHLDKIFFVVSLSSLFTGLYFIATRRKIITHVIGYLIIENGVFVLSLAVGNEMPMLVNLGIMLDIFASVLILGIFLNKIGDVFKDIDVDQLSKFEGLLKEKEKGKRKKKRRIRNKHYVFFANLTFILTTLVTKLNSDYSTLFDLD